MEKRNIELFLFPFPPFLLGMPAYFFEMFDLTSYCFYLFIYFGEWSHNVEG